MIVLRQNDKNPCLTFIIVSNGGVAMDFKDEMRSWLQDKDRQRRDGYTGDDNLTQAELEELGIFTAPTAVARDIKIGQHPRIGHSTIVEAGVTIGDDFLAGDGGFIGSGTTIGNNVVAQTSVAIAADVHIGDNVQIGSNVFIGPGVHIGAGAKIGHFVRIVGRYTPIVNDPDDPEDPHFDPTLVRTEDDNTTIGTGVEVQSFIWIGSGIVIGDKATIGSFVTVHDKASVEAKVAIADRSVVKPHEG